MYAKTTFFQLLGRIYAIVGGWYSPGMSAPIRNLPALKGGDGNLSVYLREIRKFPLLDPNEEYMLAKSWKEHGDLDAAHKLVTSHLRLVAKIAMGYRGYGLP